MKKVMLINPPTWDMISTNVPGITQRQAGYVPPLGLLYLAAYLSKFTSHAVSFLDSEAEELTYTQIRWRIEHESPHIVGITALTFNYVSALNVARIVKEINPAIRVVMGGPHPSIYPEETLISPYVDFVITGEGEKIFTMLISQIEGGLPSKKILSQLSPIDELDSLPFPARKLLKPECYRSILSQRRTRFTTIITSRGCPYRCSFCDRPRMWKGIRFRSARNVVEEIAECVGMGINEFHFYDDTFAVKDQRVLDICEGIRERNLHIHWHARTRVDTVNSKLLKSMKNAGCKSIHYGIESATPRILKILNKDISLQEAEQVVSATKALGIQTLVYFIIGSPTETREEINHTIDYAIRLKADYAHFSILIPFPATDLYCKGLEDGTIPNDYWKQFAEHPDSQFKSPMWKGDMEGKDLVALYKAAYRKFYFRPFYVLQRLRSLHSVMEFLGLARRSFELARWL